MFLPGLHPRFLLEKKEILDNTNTNKLTTPAPHSYCSARAMVPVPVRPSCAALAPLESCLFVFLAPLEASILSDTTLESLGVQKYPHIQIYRESSRATEAKQCVASFSIPRSFLFAKLLHESLDAIDQRTPEEWTAFYDQHKKDIESQQVALETILRDGRDQ